MTPEQAALHHQRHAQRLRVMLDDALGRMRVGRSLVPATPGNHHTQPEPPSAQLGLSLNPLDTRPRPAQPTPIGAGLVPWRRATSTTCDPARALDKNPARRRCLGSVDAAAV